MDSGNSGSLQSSSGDDEYNDSRHAHSISALISNTNQQASPQPGAPLNTSNTSSIFDPLSNYFDTISRPPQQQPLQTPNSLLNLEMSWPKTLRSDQNPTQINPTMVSTSSIQSPFGQNQAHGSSVLPLVAENTTNSATNTPKPPAPGAAAENNPSHVVRNPKKRSRASRRAPTTVLTTDTTNFRAMVQEFTGIPAPPFTSSPFPRTRLDLYGTPSSMRSNPLGSPQPPYLRRPFPQKVQLPPPFLASSSSSLFVDHSSSTASFSYHQLPQQGSNLFTIPNPLLTSQLKIGVLDEFGLSHGDHVNTSSLNGLPGLISSDQNSSRNDENPVNWGSGVSTNDSDHQGNGNSFNFSRIHGANKKLKFSGSSSSFHGDKGPDNVAATARGEGMMESWMCSSE